MPVVIHKRILKANILTLFFIFLSLAQYSNQTNFQIKLFKDIFRTEPNKTNQCVSPIGLYHLLSLLSNGAKGSTQEEIVSVLKAYKATNIVELNNKNINEISIIPNLHGVVIANAILTKTPPDEQFTELALKYDSLCRKFSLAKRINLYFDTKTNHEIERMVSDDLLNGGEIILLSTMTFKMDWVNQFEVENTKIAKFYKNKNDKGNYVYMMHQVLLGSRYFKDDKFEVIELPFEDLYYSALIMLPNENIDLNEYIINEFSEDVVKKYFFSINFQPFIEINLPKFKLSVENILDKNIQNLGLNKMFDSDQADFSSISHKIKLSVSKIYQKYMIEINEMGTKDFNFDLYISKKQNQSGKDKKKMHDDADKKIDPSKIIQMNITRPFLFIIKQLSVIENFVVIAKIDNISRADV